MTQVYGNNKDKLSFNSNIVRLKLKSLEPRADKVTRFNSNIVRLKFVEELSISKAAKRFNSNIVRLKWSVVQLYEKAQGKCFNSNIVRLKFLQIRYNSNHSH